MSATTATRRRPKIDQCATKVCLLPEWSEGLHALWARLYGQECGGAGQCRLSAFHWPEWEAKLAAKRASGTR